METPVLRNRLLEYGNRIPISGGRLTPHRRRSFLALATWCSLPKEKNYEIHEWRERGGMAGRESQAQISIEARAITIRLEDWEQIAVVEPGT